MTDSEYLESLPPYVNCGEKIDAHIKDSDPPWMCPPECQISSMYGYFCGGDPRNFHPDGEDCSPQEIENHKKACRAADELEAQGKRAAIENPSKWLVGDDGKAFAHILLAPFGIGVQTFPETYYEKASADA